MLGSWVFAQCVLNVPHISFFLFFFFFHFLPFLKKFFYFIFRAAPMAYGSSEASGQIGAKLPACATASATQDLRHVCDRHHTSWQCWNLGPLSEARDGTCNLWILAGFFSAVPQWELWFSFILTSR